MSHNHAQREEERGGGVMAPCRASRTTVRALLKPFGTILSILLLVGFIAVRDTEAQSAEEPEPPLTFLATIELPKLISSFAWFPDNRRLAVDADGIRVVDIVDHTVSSPLTKGIGWNVSVSPDGNYLGANGLGARLYRTDTWIIARHASGRNEGDSEKRFVKT